MNRRLLLFTLFCLPLLVITGCWDRKELNDRAMWAATGFDVGARNTIKVSGQIIVAANVQSSGGGGGGGAGGGGGCGGGEKSYFVTSESGLNLGGALQRIQSTLSREAFFGQRRVIIIGEDFAKRGLLKELDASVRGAEVGLRTDLMVVKNGTAQEALKVPSMLEKVPAMAALKKHETIGGRSDTAFLDFLISANSEGIRPTLPVIEIYKLKGHSKSKFLRMAGVAVFDRKLKLAGYLNVGEDLDLLWVLGKLKKTDIIDLHKRRGR